MQEPEKNKKDFSISEVISEGWQMTKAKFGSILLLEIIGFACLGIAAFLSYKLVRSIPGIGETLDSIVHLLLQCLLSIAAIHIGLKIADGQDFTVSDLISRAGLALKYFASLICYQIAVVLGLICFIIPGIIIMIRFGLFGFFIVDKGAGPIEALKMSWETVKGASWKYFLFQIVSFLINVVGLLCLGIGFFFSFPITLLASVLVYRSLYNQTIWNKTTIN
jgi:hypothetical protein